MTNASRRTGSALMRMDGGRFHLAECDALAQGNAFRSLEDAEGQTPTLWVQLAAGGVTLVESLGGEVGPCA